VVVRARVAESVTRETERRAAKGFRAADGAWTMMGAAMGVLLLADFFDECLGWLVAGLLPELRGHFKLDYLRAGWVLTAHLAGGYLGGALGGVLADLYDRRRLLLSGAALYACGLALAGAATSFGILLLGCVCIGLASGPVAHTAQLILVDRARDGQERLEKVLGRFNALGSVGALLGPVSLAAALGVGLGWRSGFAAGALVMAVYAFALGTVRPASHVAPPAQAEKRAGWALMRETITDVRLLRLALALALLDGLDEPFAGFVILFLRDVSGTSGALANATAAVLVGSPLVGFALAARLPWRRATIMRSSLALLGAALGAFLLAPGMLAKAACLAAAGTATAVFYTTSLAAVLSLRPSSTGTVTSVLSVVGTLSLLIPPLVGQIADARDLTSAMFIYAALPLVMLLLVGGVDAERSETGPDRP
jgi:predicted MFS family arabinose efflux permease